MAKNWTHVLTNGHWIGDPYEDERITTKREMAFRNAIRNAKSVWDMKETSEIQDTWFEKPTKKTRKPAKEEASNENAKNASEA